MEVWKDTGDEFQELKALWYTAVQPGKNVGNVNNNSFAHFSFIHQI